VELTLIELSQMSDSDSDDGGGRRPKILKPIFNKAAQETPQAQQSAAAQPAVQPTVADSNAAGMTQHNAPVVNTSYGRPQPTHPAPAATQAPAPTPTPTIQQGRPAELRTRNEEGGSLGKMFRRSRSAIETSAPPAAAPVETAKVETAKFEEARPTAQPAPPATVAITDSTVSQAWTSFALLLPDNERALADRMKIMSPKAEGRDSFVISVDNQMAADLFTREEKRICEGMAPYLGNTVLKMRIVVNKVVVERHVSDKSKQYAILVEKNPLIEKLRQELNLEVAR
jgi:DNA polymerase-3 subunit gamma/tau